MMLPRTIMALFWGLVILWLMQGDGVAKASVKSAAAPWTAKIEGDSMDGHAQAKKIALEKAQRVVEDYLLQQSYGTGSHRSTMFRNIWWKVKLPGRISRTALMSSRNGS